ncbi:MAG: hypothetical protein ACTSQL_09500 [Promethearchaeota archaeon]
MNSNRIYCLKHKAHSFECAFFPYNFTKWRGTGLNRRPRAYESPIFTSDYSYG